MGDVDQEAAVGAQQPVEPDVPRPLLRDPPPPPGYTNPVEESDILEKLFSAEKGS